MQAKTMFWLAMAAALIAAWFLLVNDRDGQGQRDVEHPVPSYANGSS
jgi:hypothetical protein